MLPLLWLELLPLLLFLLEDAALSWWDAEPLLPELPWEFLWLWFLFFAPWPLPEDFRRERRRFLLERLRLVFPPEPP